MKVIARPYKFARILYKAYKPLADTPIIKRRHLRDLLHSYGSRALGLKNSTSLDLGCGASPQNPFDAAEVYGIDIHESADGRIRKADLIRDPIPFGDDMFDYMTAYNFLEHVPRIVYCPERRFAFVELMNEIWRTLKPGGLLFSETPIYPYSPVYRDPTHINMMTEETFPIYFSNPVRFAKNYGFHGAFEVLHQFVREPCLMSVLRKTSP
jgi:SAM-dependent methyltransferase